MCIPSYVIHLPLSFPFVSLSRATTTRVSLRLGMKIGMNVRLAVAMRMGSKCAVPF